MPFDIDAIMAHREFPGEFSERLLVPFLTDVSAVLEAMMGLGTIGWPGAQE